MVQFLHRYRFKLEATTVFCFHLYFAGKFICLFLSFYRAGDFAVPFAFAFNLQEVRFFFEIETIFFLLVFQVTLHFLCFFTLRVFDFPFVRVIDFWESFGFFAFASVDAVFVRNEDRQKNGNQAVGNYLLICFI